jgi:3-oxoacyl-[acyl-carrier protein] reductase
MTRYNQIHIGDKAEIKHLISETDINSFIELTGDDNRLHHDKNYARNTPFKKPIAHGMLSVSFISTIIGTKLPGDGALWFSQNIEFKLPVRVGDEITIVVEVLNKNDNTQIIELSTDIYNQNKQKVISGSAKVKVIEEEFKQEKVNLINTKNVLILGATGGIGKSVAKKFAANGYDIFLHYFSNSTDAKILESQLSNYGINVKSIYADLRKTSDIKNLYEITQRYTDYISVIINATTLPLSNIKVEDISWNDFLEHLHFNIKINLDVIRQFLPTMKEKKYGKIVTFISNAIEEPNADWLHYITAKSALSGFSKAMAIELAKYGIRMNMVSPGMTETDLIAEIPEKFRLLYAAKNPLKRLATTEDIANAVFFLGSIDSDYLIGETIRVNGGKFTL